MSDDKKFILMNLDDEKSKKVAEVISNPTCKKILNYLADNPEKSEEDISKDLGIPLNTAEYNLKKLVESGLVEKSKNFFWSKKGKKINLYKPANRHIVISPKKRPDMNILKSIVPVLIIAVVAVIAVVMLLNNSDEIKEQTSNDFKNFNSLSELKDFLKENQEQGNFYNDAMRGGAVTGAPAMAAETTSGSGSATMASGADSKSSATDYSQTNIQVEGVDEADIVKNDGKYIYIVTYGSQGKIVIVNAFPAENMKILSEINITNAFEILINGDKLIVFSNDYSSYSSTIASIYDVTDRRNPILDKKISLDGNYVTSRMIGDYVYLIANQYADSGNIILPALTVDGVKETMPVTDIAYFPYPDTSYVFTNILALNVDSGDHESKTYLAGASYNIYVSENNVYLTYTKTLNYNTYFEEMIEEVFIPLLPEDKVSEVRDIMSSDKQQWEKSGEISEIVYDYSASLKGEAKEEFDEKFFNETQEFAEDFQKRNEKTVVHKIAVDNLNINYLTNGEVPGHLLNQFSMDEHKDYFRVATTTGNSWGARASSLNHMYVLDEDLEIVGSVSDLAKGERIYSTRFMGDRAYMVTFRQVDPLFVIGLSDPESPEVLGQLKVTGFSSYLHPYDENHIIGIGKEATEEGRVQGLKIAIFDVSDVSNPIEKAKYEVEEQWSDSNALYEYKAFLFDKEKNLLVLPVTYHIQEPMVENTAGKINPYYYYRYWQGAFVFNINENEISLRGKIDHDNDASQDYYYNSAVQRSLFMDDVLYTISQKIVAANDLNTLDRISSVDLPYEEYYYGFYDKGGVGIATEVGASVAIERSLVK